MSRTITPLSDSAYRSAKPTDRAYKLFDGDSLYLLVQPNAREGLTSFGNYPVACLADARNKRQIRVNVTRMKSKPGTGAERKN